MNARWLTRASVFESPKVPRCKRGHNLERAGIYVVSQVVRGKRYTTTKCAACASENVQRCRMRKRQAELVAA